MTSRNNKNCGRAHQLNLNEMYNDSVHLNLQFNHFNKLQGLNYLSFFLTTWNSESKVQSSEDIGNVVIGELAHVIPNQQRYRRIFKALWKISRPWLLYYAPNHGPATSL